MSRHPSRPVGPYGLIPAQFRALARVERAGERGVLMREEGIYLRPTLLDLRACGLITVMASGIQSGEGDWNFCRITDLGRRVLVESACDDLIPAVDPAMIRFDSDPDCKRSGYISIARFHDARGMFGDLLSHREVPNGAPCTVRFYDHVPADAQFLPGMYYVAPIDAFGTCVQPGSPEGGWARLLDLAIDAGLRMPEPITLEENNR